MLAAGAPLLAVLISFLGADSAGRAETARWLQALAELPTLHSRRAVLAHFLRTFEHAQLHGSQWRAVDHRAFVGRAHELERELSEHFDMATGEVSHVERIRRRHCPAKRAGGLAARSGRSPRQLHRYRAHLRAAELMCSKQPPVDASDAVRPRASDGRWAYAQHWLARPPTPEMLSRWRAHKRRKPVRRTQLPTGPFTAAVPPRVDALRALAAHAERRD